MTHARMTGLALVLGLGTLAGGEVIITFDKAETGKPVPSFTTQGVVFALARPPAKSHAAGRVMFFPHLKTPRKGILNAMANESIPVEIRLPKPVASVTLVLWGSIGSTALVEAYGKDDKVGLMSKLSGLVLFAALACSGVSNAQPVREYDDKGAPPFKVLNEGENPLLDAYDNFVIGPKYTPAPERKVVEGVPQGNERCAG